MSRVHEALRRAGWGTNGKPARRRPRGAAVPALHGLLEMISEVPFTPAPEWNLIHPDRLDAHTEEFRSLRTRLNHFQKLHPVHSLVITSPCPGEGKSFTAVNLALAEAQLEGNATLLADFDFRLPTLHNLFQTERAPGATDYLRGTAPLHAAIRKIAGLNLYLMPAGEPVNNPLELLNADETRELLVQLPSVFNWVILDTPPLLFTADANLLATMCDGTVLVVRIGSTTIDSVVRAMQSLCENNVLGVVANCARAGELYHKYTYYYSSHYSREQPAEAE